MKVQNIELVDSYKQDGVMEYWFEMEVEGLAESEEAELMTFGIVQKMDLLVFLRYQK